jgi:hypothetical protein
MNAKDMSIVAVAIIAVMLIAATALTTADNAFADKKKKTHYEASQAGSQINDCGNDDNPMFVFCQNLLSQLQGDGNAVIIMGAQPSESADMAVP